MSSNHYLWATTVSFFTLISSSLLNNTTVESSCNYIETKIQLMYLYMRSTEHFACI